MQKAFTSKSYFYRKRMHYNVIVLFSDSLGEGMSVFTPSELKWFLPLYNSSVNSQHSFDFSSLDGVQAEALEHWAAEPQRSQWRAVVRHAISMIMIVQLSFLSLCFDVSIDQCRCDEFE